MEFSHAGVDVASSRTESSYLDMNFLRYLRYNSVQEDLRSQGGKRCFIDYAVQFWHMYIPRLRLRFGAVSQDIIKYLHSKTPDSIDEIEKFYGMPIKVVYAAGHPRLVIHLAALGAKLNISTGC